MRSAFGAALAVFLLAGGARAQDAGPDRTVSREEHEQLRQQLEALQEELQGLREGAEVAQEESDQTATDFEQALRDVREKAMSALPGSTRFLITGYGSAGFSYRRPTRGGARSKSAFGASLSPIFLWRASERVFFEAEPELELEDDETELKLEYADAAITLNDYLVVRAGMFLTPLSHFTESLHPAWINKLPDAPLHAAEEGGLVPYSSVGAELRGAVPVGALKVAYAAFVANGPRLVTDDPDELGTLSFDNFDGFNNPALGGRASVFLLPEFELGASGLYGRFGERGTSFRGVDGYLIGAFANFTRDVEALAGTIDVRAEWVLSRVETATYDPTGALGVGPVRFRNQRQGGYVQVAYRPATVDVVVVKDLEVIFRFDWLDLPRGGPVRGHERRFTGGVDYWITSSVVLKAAYELTEGRGAGQPATEEHAVLAQLGVGF
jgi:hypothetical protein